MVKIDTDIPMPRKGRSAGITKFPFADMNVGDSFLYDKKLLTARKIASAAKKRLGNGVHFYVAETAEGVRIWREK